MAVLEKSENAASKVAGALCSASMIKYLTDLGFEVNGSVKKCFSAATAWLFISALRGGLTEQGWQDIHDNNQENGIMAAYSGIQYINLTDPLLTTGLAGVEAMVTHNSNTSADSFRILGLIVPGPQYDVDGTTLHIAIGDDQAISFKLELI